MQFYSSPDQHIKMVIEGLEHDLKIEIEDYTKMYLDNGLSAFTYAIGDIEPLGINSIGQQQHNIEMEIRLAVPISKVTSKGVGAQLYAVGVATKITELLRTKYYGLDDQRKVPEIETNRAIPISKKGDESFIGRSIIFTQDIYLGAPTEQAFAISFDEVREHERS